MTRGGPGAGAVPAESPGRWETETDVEGVAPFCGVAAGAPLGISVTSFGTVLHQETVTIPAGALGSRTVRVGSGRRSG